MRYRRFHISNFKGIKDTTIDLGESDIPSVFTFVGLNESGKTTILEAIHSFAPDKATSELVGGDEKTGVPYSLRVPRHVISNFSGDVTVTATISVDENDIDSIKNELSKKHLYIDEKQFSGDIELIRKQRFANGDFKSNHFFIKSPLHVKSGRQRQFRTPTVEEHTLVRDTIYRLVPSIAYFPTFVFNFPSKIFLTRDDLGPINSFYKSVFQDILDYDGKGLTIEDSIVSRVRGESAEVPYLEFLSFWSRLADKNKIQHVIDRAGATVTEVVFGRWNSIFGENTGAKEITITFEPSEGETTDKSGNKVRTTKHDLFIQFKIKDGTRRFEVNDRSLGFRWFFAFMLFTQFRVSRTDSQPVFFLFDEPASNLHAAAQQKLIESFPGIAKKGHMLAYTTHSHYMIEPKWLEQTFIVTNRSDAPQKSIIENASLDDESLDIQAMKYNKFVNAHPSQMSYFQPIVDRLNVVPSKFDLSYRSIIVEGKSDYYILRYCYKLLGIQEQPLVPALGAGTLEALLALHVGWGVRLLCLLDGDKQGKAERERYINEFGLTNDVIITLDELLPGAKKIENIVDGDAERIVAEAIGVSTVGKKEILRFFQERLAADQVISLGSTFEENAKILLDALAKRLPVITTEDRAR